MMSSKKYGLKKTKVVQSGVKTLTIESAAIAALIPRLGEAFERAVDLISNSNGRVIVTGIGKSGIIAKKIVATLNSTGTSAIFLHPVEGLHGDVGVALKNDVIICVSKSDSIGPR